MSKLIVTLCLCVFSLNICLSQNALAKIEYSEAETDFQAGKYQESLEHLETVKDMLGSTNAKVMYLEILNMDKILANKPKPEMTDEEYLAERRKYYRRYDSEALKKIKALNEKFKNRTPKKEYTGPTLIYLKKIKALDEISNYYIINFEEKVPIEKLKIVYEINKQYREFSIEIDEIIKAKVYIDGGDIESAYLPLENACNSGNTMACEMYANFSKNAELKKTQKDIIAKLQNEMTLVEGEDSFYISKYEITDSQIEAILPEKFYIIFNRPAKTITVDFAKKFIAALNDYTGLKYRFPTETEWEYAANGGLKSEGKTYPGNDDIDEVASYRKNTYNLRDKGSYLPNELGLYDMSGSLWELCVNDTGNFILKGGSWKSSKKECQPQNNKAIEYISFDTGLRLVLDKN